MGRCCLGNWSPRTKHAFLCVVLRPKFHNLSVSFSLTQFAPTLFIHLSYFISPERLLFHHYQRGHRPPTIPYCFCISFLRSSHVDTLTRITVAKVRCREKELKSYLCRPSSSDNNASDINNANMSNSVFSTDDSELTFVSSSMFFSRTESYFLL
ncbi:unnamed protein product [Acanthosepion pharaonis]|uniref:Uncharacterized protein n=1 Tax=Acanthosepion pharaonis TaxID=158019 RepID=A0A812BHG1_ACAPH|nr:unnamed protein product [Sepia pharaonis]